MSDTPGHPSRLSQRPEPSEGPAARLSAQWRHGQGPDLRAFLAGVGRLGAAELTDVLCTDQRQRWLHGQRPEVEAYIALHGSFHPGAEPAIDLIFGEFLARRERGESPTLDEYSRRFPEFAGQLRLHVSLYDALAQVRPPRDDPPSGLGEDLTTVSRVARMLAIAGGRPQAPSPRGPEAGAFESDYESFKRLLHEMDQERSAATLLAASPVGFEQRRLWTPFNRSARGWCGTRASTSSASRFASSSRWFARRHSA